MTYHVLMEVDTTVEVDVEADSPGEAFENASISGVNCGDLDVNGAHPLKATDDAGNTTESDW